MASVIKSDILTPPTIDLTAPEGSVRCQLRSLPLLVRTQMPAPTDGLGLCPPGGDVPGAGSAQVLQYAQCGRRARRYGVVRFGARRPTPGAPVVGVSVAALQLLGRRGEMRRASFFTTIGLGGCCLRVPR